MEYRPGYSTHRSTGVCKKRSLVSFLFVINWYIHIFTPTKFIITILFSIFSLCGFRDAVTIKNIDETVILYVENYIKTDLVKLLLKNDEEYDRCMFFGKRYATDPESFVFSLGEKIQLKEIAIFANKIFNKPGPRFFSANSGKMKNILDTINFRDTGRLFIDKRNNQHNSVQETNKREEIVDEEKLKSKLLADTQLTLKSLKVSQEHINKLTEKNITVEIDNGNITGKIECVLCDEPRTKRQKKEHTVSTKFEKGTYYWILSNYSKHFKNMHGANKTGSATCKNNVTMSKSIQNVSSNEVKPDSEDEADKIKRIMRLRISECTLGMISACEINGEQQESINFICGEDKVPLKIVRVPEDGNCLFSAAVHQLKKVNSKDEQLSVLARELRAEVVSFISANIPLFELDLKGHILDKKNKKIENLGNEYQHFLDTKLSKDGKWAGTESLRAIRLLYKVNILIVNEQGEYYFANTFDENLDSNSLLILAFRVTAGITASEKNITNENRNHYDSGIYIEPTNVFSMAEVLFDKLQKSRSISSISDIIELN